VVEYPSLLYPQTIQRKTGTVGTHREGVSEEMGENAYRVDEELGSFRFSKTHQRT
tara:strand:- start:374 stop:538 length:165 start_codon:yes stop_codon:yes gene_type:complete